MRYAHVTKLNFFAHSLPITASSAVIFTFRAKESLSLFA